MNFKQNAGNIEENKTCLYARNMLPKKGKRGYLAQNLSWFFFWWAAASLLNSFAGLLGLAGCRICSALLTCLLFFCFFCALRGMSYLGIALLPFWGGRALHGNLCFFFSPLEKNLGMPRMNEVFRCHWPPFLTSHPAPPRRYQFWRRIP